jgi:MFS superfamily sulfate permease-like transporter
MVKKVKSYAGSLRNDLPSSIVVFLVALPLCLGIALASGAPLFSGIIAGMIGGIVVGSLSGSQLSVSGPAAGLSTIVAAAILKLEVYEAFLVAVVLGGIFQIILGALKAGILGDYIPSSVIKGMLAAIGVILILKQFPLLVTTPTPKATKLFARPMAIIPSAVYMIVCVTCCPALLSLGLCRWPL